MPAVITLDDLTAMNEADIHGYRYETSSEGTLSVVPSAGSDHQIIITELVLWLGGAGWTAKQVLTNPGLRIPGRAVDAGRIPDLGVWAKRPPSAVWLPTTDLLLVVEVISPGSESTDRVAKVNEYASADIPQYWMVAQDVVNTVTIFQLGADHLYRTVAQVPLAWLLETSPDEHLHRP
jgi:Uma2 family endonuclease